MRKASTLALIIGAFVLISPLALRADMTPSQSFTITTDTSGSGNVDVNQFDPSLGTLTGFTVTLKGSITWNATVPNDSGDFQLSDTTYTQNFNADTIGSYTININFSGSNVNSGVLPYWTGTSTNSFDFSADVPLGDTFTPATLNGTIVYDYTPATSPVPEPSSVLLLGMGLLGLAVIGGLKKRAAQSSSGPE